MRLAAALTAVGELARTSPELDLQPAHFGGTLAVLKGESDPLPEEMIPAGVRFAPARRLLGAALAGYISGGVRFPTDALISVRQR